MFCIFVGYLIYGPLHLSCFLLGLKPSTKHQRNYNFSAKHRGPIYYPAFIKGNAEEIVVQ